MDKKQALQKASTSKKKVGLPKKEVHLQLLKPKLEQPLKKTKVRGSYNNLFCPFLWRPIHATMKRDRNYYATLLYLQAVYKKPRETRSIYDALGRSTLYRWITSTGVLREKYKHCV